MSIAASDLVCFCAASRPESDTTTSGGAIDLTMRPVFSQLASPVVIAAISDGTDVRTLTVTGRNSAGAVVTEAIVLTSAVEAVGLTTFERIQKATLSATSASRTVTVKAGSGGSTIATIPVNETGFSLLFMNSASESGSVTRTEKIFWRNGHGSLSLTTAELKLTADPSSRIRCAVALAVNDSVSVANRKTLPATVVFVDDNVAMTVPGGSLATTANIGLWINQELLAADNPFKSTFTTQLSGNTA